MTAAREQDIERSVDRLALVDDQNRRRRAACVVAALSLRDDFVPRSFLRSAAKRELESISDDAEAIDATLLRLKANGVLQGIIQNRLFWCRIA
jgi:ABC-type amino acid transport substrate-binding protein